MTKIVENSSGCVIDEVRYYENVYQDVGYRYNPTLYQIYEPFMMDSQYMAQETRSFPAGGMMNDHKEKANPGERSADSATSSDEELDVGPSSLDDYIAKEAGLLCSIGVGIRYFDQRTDRSFGNNRQARELVAAASRYVITPKAVDRRVEVLTLMHHSLDDEHQEVVSGRVNVNDADHCLQVWWKDASYVIPHRSAFYAGDINFVYKLLHGRHKYSLIVIDPPWPNRCVKRQMSYDTTRKLQLWKSMPIDGLLERNGLVALWVTNSPSVRSFVEDDLLKSWHLKQLASWIWIKVTRSGKPVCDFGKMSGKKPYETLLLAAGKRCGSSFKDLPKNHLLISVPSAVPSRKPPLREVLQPWLPDSFSCLELFARGLQPNTTSVGDEVLKMQHLAWFVPC